MTVDEGVLRRVAEGLLDIESGRLRSNYYDQLEIRVRKPVRGAMGERDRWIPFLGWLTTDRIVDALEERGWAVRYHGYPDLDPPYRWFVKPDGPEVVGEGDSRLEALCQTALEAVDDA